MIHSLLAALLAVGASASSQLKLDWTRVEDEHFHFEVPSYMESTDELNDAADYQYSYVEAVGAETRELYMILLVETKEEIAAYNLSYEFDALSYWNLSAANIASGLDKMKMLTKNPYIESRQEMKLTRGNLSGKFGKIKVTYHLGVYEGDYAFYQFLTWTLSDQYEDYKADMEAMVESFEEK